MSKRLEIDSNQYNRYLHNLTQWYQLPSTPGEYMSIASYRASEIMTHLPEARMILGSGYPYYVVGAEDQNIPEFTRFYTKVQHEAAESAHNGKLVLDTNSKCEGAFPMKQFIRTLPDIDLFVVVDHISAEIEEKLSLLLELWSEPNPDVNPHVALNSLATYLDIAINNPDCQQQTLPPIRTDLYISTVESFDSAYRSVSEHRLTESHIRTRAFHGSWQDYTDMLAEDIFTARTVDPLAIQPAYEGVFNKWLDMISDFVIRAGSNETVIETWFTFLTNYTNGKNRRLLESSDSLMQLIHHRIDLARSRVRNRTE